MVEVICPRCGRKGSLIARMVWRRLYWMVDHREATGVKEVVGKDGKVRKRKIWKRWSCYLGPVDGYATTRSPEFGGGKVESKFVAALPEEAKKEVLERYWARRRAGKIGPRARR